MDTSPNEKDRPKPETVEAIYDYMKTVPEAQRNYWNDLDRKMVQIFQAASIVVGLIGFTSGNMVQANGAVGLILIVSR